MINPHPDILIFNSPNAEFATVFSALQVYLGREPKEQDLKLLTKKMDKVNPNKFLLVYNKISLGTIRVKYRLNQVEPFKVSFIPLATSN